MSELSAELPVEAIPETETNIVLDTSPEEQPQQQVESAPAPEEKITFTDDQQRVFDDAIGKKTFKLREQERRADALQQELQEAQASSKSQETRPDVPPIADRYDFDSDDDYNASINKRDQAIAQQAAYDAGQNIFKQQNQQLQAQKAAQQQQAMYQSVQQYSERANKYGITQQELESAGRNIASYGISNNLEQHILNDENGPLITVYLGNNANATTLDKLSRMDDMSAAIFINSQIKPKAEAFKPRTTTAPQPVETLRGTGVPKKERGPTGATFV